MAKPFKYPEHLAILLGLQVGDYHEIFLHPRESVKGFNKSLQNAVHRHTLQLPDPTRKYTYATAIVPAGPLEGYVRVTITRVKIFPRKTLYRYLEK